MVMDESPITVLMTHRSHRSSPTQHRSSPTQHRSSPTQHRSSPTQHRSSPTHHRSSPTHHRSSPTQHRSSPTQHRSSPTHHRSSLQQHAPSGNQSTAPHRTTPTERDATPRCSTQLNMADRRHHTTAPRITMRPPTTNRPRVQWCVTSMLANWGKFGMTALHCVTVPTPQVTAMHCWLGAAGDPKRTISHGHPGPTKYCCDVVIPLQTHKDTPCTLSGAQIGPNWSNAIQRGDNKSKGRQQVKGATTSQRGDNKSPGCARAPVAVFRWICAPRFTWRKSGWACASLAPIARPMRLTSATPVRLVGAKLTELPPPPPALPLCTFLAPELPVCAFLAR